MVYHWRLGSVTLVLFVLCLTGCGGKLPAPAAVPTATPPPPFTNLAAPEAAVQVVTGYVLANGVSGGDSAVFPKTTRQLDVLFTLTGLTPEMRPDLKVWRGDGLPGRSQAITWSTLTPITGPTTLDFVLLPQDGAFFALPYSATLSLEGQPVAQVNWAMTSTATLNATPTIPSAVPGSQVSGMDTLLPEAAKACETAFASASPPAPPASLPSNTFLSLSEGEGDVSYDWKLVAPQLPFLLASAPAEVRYVLCDREQFSRSGTYTDGTPAYTTQPEVRVAEYPSGKVVVSREFDSIAPPEAKVHSGAAAGAFQPTSLAPWLYSLLDNGAICYGQGVFAANGNIYLCSQKPSAGQTGLARLKAMDVKAGHTTLFDFPAGNAAISPDGTLAAAQSALDGSVRLFEVASGRELRVIQAGVSDPKDFRFVKLEFSADARTLLVFRIAVGVLDLVDVASGEARSTLKAGATSAFSPDGTLLAVAGPEAVTVASLPEGKEVWRLAYGDFKGNPNYSRLAFSADGRSLVLISFDGIRPVFIWDLATGQERFRMNQTARIGQMAANGAFLAVQQDERTVQVVDVASGQVRLTFQAADELYSFAISGDGGRLAVSANRAVTVIQVVEGTVAQVIINSCDSLNFAEGSDQLKCGDEPYAGPSALPPGGPTAPATAPISASSPDGRLAAGLDPKGNLTLTEAATGKALGELATHCVSQAIPCRLSFSPDGNTLLIIYTTGVGPEQVIRLIDIETLLKQPGP